MATDRPTITPSELTRPFWDACERGELVAQRCAACDAYRHYPQLLCPDCLSPDYAWAPLSGRGTIYSYSVAHRAFHPAWAEHVPYVVATIELEEGVRMVTDLLDVEPERVAIGDAVAVHFEVMPGQPRVPRFRLVGTSDE